MYVLNKRVHRTSFFVFVSALKKALIFWLCKLCVTKIVYLDDFLINFQEKFWKKQSLGASYKSIFLRNAS